MEIRLCRVAGHAGGVVVRAGWYGERPRRRQRWLCRLPDGGAPHRFTPVLTRQGEPDPFCEECSTALESWEGRAGAREYRFAAREVGEALVAVARGSSYRSAAEAARRAADRLPEAALGRREWRYRDPARDGQLVANWVDVFSELVCAGELPERWPQVLLIDSRGFRITTGERAGRGFYVLAGVGSDIDEHGRQRRGRLWRLEAFARKHQAAWEAFFGECRRNCVGMDESERHVYEKQQDRGVGGSRRRRAERARRASAARRRPRVGGWVCAVAGAAWGWPGGAARAVG